MHCAPETKLVNIRDLNSETNDLAFHVIVKVEQKLNTIKMGNGRRILKFNVVDQEGSQIECICYEETHDKFFSVIQEGKVLKIVQPDVNKANKQHTQI